MDNTIHYRIHQLRDDKQSPFATTTSIELLFPDDIFICKKYAEEQNYDIRKTTLQEVNTLTDEQIERLDTHRDLDIYFKNFELFKSNSNING